MASNSSPPSPTSEKPQTEDTPDILPGNNIVREKVYLKGVKLTVLLASLTLVTFLVLLDTSILGTVST